MSGRRGPYPDDVPLLLTQAERWLYRFCGTGSVSGVSGPHVTVQDLLEDINDLRETKDDLLAALEPAFERCKTSGNFRPTMDWMKLADAAIARARLCAGTK